MKMKARLSRCKSLLSTTLRGRQGPVWTVLILYVSWHSSGTVRAACLSAPYSERRPYWSQVLPQYLRTLRGKCKTPKGTCMHYVHTLRGGRDEEDEHKNQRRDSLLGKRPGGTSVASEGKEEIMSDRKASSKLEVLLQRAAAYSAFLRERLQQSRSILNSTDMSQSRSILNSTDMSTRNMSVDPRQPKLVTGAVLRGYQVDGVQWLVSLYENGLNGILADEMGLGKTLQVIAFFAHLLEMKVKGPFLVVAPLSTVGNWVKEFQRFAPDVPVMLYHGNKEERSLIRKRHLNIVGGKFLGRRGALPVIITSFEIAMNDAKMLALVPWKYLAVDEGHRLKNKDSKLLRNLKTLNAGNRLLLTGTPLQNSMTELWSLLNFILPDVFDSLETFQGWFDFDELVAATQGGSQGDKEAAASKHASAAAKILVQEEENKIVSKLHAILDPFVLRRLKSDVVAELAAKHVYVLFASLTPAQLRLNKAIKERRVEEMYRTLEEEEEAHAVAGETMTKTKPGSSSLNNLMMQARKNCNHPFLFQAPMDDKGEWVIDERFVTCSGKMLLLDRMLKVLHAHGHKVLVFFQMTRMMDIVEDYIEELRGWKCCRIDGSVPLAVRQDQIQLFQSDASMFVFLLSTRSGGQGISLPAADTVILYDSDFNPQQDLQAQDRCHRIGQLRSVAVYRLITRDSIEEHILERSVTKRKLELMTINRHHFKAHQKIQGSTDVSSILRGGVNVKNSFSAQQLELLLSVNVKPSMEGLISDDDLSRLLLERGASAAASNGVGWEVVDAETSSFVQ